MTGTRAIIFAAVLLFPPFITMDARAQSAEEVQAARDTFAAALKAEEEHHCVDALEKYRIVQRVKDTPQVRYRIGTCLVAVGKLREGREMLASIHARPGNQDERETEQASAEMLKTLATRVPDLTVKVDGPAATSGVITIDGVAIRAGTPTEIDPGEHAIVLSGAGVKHTETRVTVAEASHQVITLTVEPDVAVTPPRREHSEVTAAPPPEPSSRRTYGYVVMGVGGALLVGSVISIILQRGQVSTIDADCPSPSFVCPLSKKEEVLSARSNANTDDALAVSLGAGAAVVGAIGAYLVLTSHTQVTVAPSPTGASLRIGGAF